MFHIALFAILAAALTSTPQPNREAAAEIDAAANDLSNCIGTNAERADPGATPEVAASAVVATCTPHRSRLVNLVEAAVLNLPPEQRGPARERLRTSFDTLETQIAEAIRAQRSAEAAAPAQSGAAPD